MTASLHDPRGSVWRRWDPHIHAPGTVLNNQFGGAAAWDAYLTRLEESDPPIEAIGLTDYCNFDQYSTILEFKKAGRLPRVGLIFPNIEMRFGVGTDRGAAVNVHLLISPEDPDHIDLARRFLLGIQFRSGGEVYRCIPDDLMRLGRTNRPGVIDDRAALIEGTNQFKVQVADLQDAFDRSRWAQDNIIVGVAGSSVDGTAGLQKDDQLTLTRREIERMSRVIFSSQPSQREFWLGRKSVPIETLERDWDGRKSMSSRLGCA